MYAFVICVQTISTTHRWRPNFSPLSTPRLAILALTPRFRKKRRRRE
jgi:hypothetical protein